MAVRKPRKPTVYETSVTLTVYGEEIEPNVTVHYDFEPGEREIRYGDNANPGCDSSCEVSKVYVKATGEDITSLCDLDGLAEDIRLWIEDRAESDRYDYAESRRDR